MIPRLVDFSRVFFQVYSFVPIPGAQQHKRPRRRYEEIERMYKCGFQGCEKAYGTLNHLNAHVTMQSHGQKRTPEGELILSSLTRLSHSLSFVFFAFRRENNGACSSSRLVLVLIGKPEIVV